MKIEYKKQYVCEKCGKAFDNAEECMACEGPAPRAKRVYLYFNPVSEQFSTDAIYIDDCAAEYLDDIVYKDVNIEDDDTVSIVWCTQCVDNEAALAKAHMRLQKAAYEFFSRNAKQLDYCERAGDGKVQER